MHSKAYVLFTAGILAMLASPSQIFAGTTLPDGARFDLIIGNLCIGDLPAKSRIVTHSIQQGPDVYEDWAVGWREESAPARRKTRSVRKVASAPQPIVRFFRDELPKAPGLSCRELDGSVLLEGNIEHIRMQARISSPGNRAASRIAIPREGLSIKMGHVHSGLATLFGGTIDLAGSRAWIENSVALKEVDGNRPEGAIEITSWARRVVGARFMLQSDGSPVSINLASSRENVTLKVPLDGTDTELLVGHLKGDPLPAAVALFTLPSVAFSGALVDVSELLVERNRKDTTVSLMETAVRFQSAKLESRRSVARLGAGDATIASITSRISPSADVITIDDPTIAKVAARAPDCDSQLAGAPFLTAARCTAKVNRANRVSAQLGLSAESVGTVGFGHVFAPVAESVIAYDIDAQHDLETFSGRMSPLIAKIGRVRLADLHAVTMASTAIGPGQINIPISIDVPAGSGKLLVDTSGGQVALEGRLNRLALKGVLALTWNGAPAWALTIGAGDLACDVSGIATYEPVLFGGQTQFAGAAIRFESKTALLIQAAGSTGRILFTPQLVAVLDPKLSLGRSPEGVRFNAPARFEASTSLTIDIADGHIDVEKGRLLIEQASARVEPGQPATLGDIRIEDGDVRFARLAADFEQGIGSVTIDRFEASARTFGTVPPADGGSAADQLQWSGRGEELVRSASVSAMIRPDARSRERLKLESVTIRDTCIAVTDAKVGRAGAFVVTGERLKVCIQTWSDDLLRGTLDFRNGFVTAQDADLEGRMSVPSLQLDITGGTPTRPQGRGRITTAAMDMNFRTDLEIKNSCIGVPDFQSIRASTHVAAAAAQLEAVLSDGILTGAGAILLANAHFKNSGDYDCRSELLDVKLWDAVRVKTKVPCPTWRDPFRFCMKEMTIIPEARISIDARTHVSRVEADLSALDPRLELRPDDGKVKIKVCAGNYSQATPFIDMFATLQPRTPVPAFDRFVGNLTGQVLRPVQSAFFTSIANLFTTSISVLRVFGAGHFCT